jgi:hypothetical protein
MRTISAESCATPAAWKWRRYVCNCQGCAEVGRAADRARKQRTGGHQPRAELVDTEPARRVIASRIARGYSRDVIARQAGIGHETLARVIRQQTAPSTTVQAIVDLGEMGSVR